jgi:hypothetical protein
MALASVELTKITRLRRGVVDYAAVNQEYKNLASAGMMHDFSNSGLSGMNTRKDSNA